MFVFLALLVVGFVSWLLLLNPFKKPVGPASVCAFRPDPANDRWCVAPGCGAFVSRAFCFLHACAAWVKDRAAFERLSVFDGLFCVFLNRPDATAVEPVDVAVQRWSGNPLELHRKYTTVGHLLP